MAIASITITCATCGKEFEHRKVCHNRSEADNYVRWAADHIDTCPTCRAKQAAEQMADKLSTVLAKCGYQLPELTGASDKQIAYAAKVRERYLAQHLGCIEKYHKVQQRLNDAEYAANYARLCAEHGITVEDAIRENMEAMNLTTVQLMLTSTSAREILDSNC